MRVVKVHAHIEVACPRCGGSAVVMGLAAVTSDGRVGEPQLAVEPKGPEDERLCRPCEDERQAHDRRTVNAENRRHRQQRKWAERKVW